VQCQSNVVLAPLMVVSCFTDPTAPQDGQLVGGVGLIALSGMESGDPITASGKDDGPRLDVREGSQKLGNGARHRAVMITLILADLHA